MAYTGQEKRYPTVADVRKASASAKATAVKSYTKGSYTYTESSPGSNKFQNFKAGEPMGERNKPAMKAKAPVKSAVSSSAKVATKAPVSSPAFAKGLADRQTMPSKKTVDSRASFPKGKGTASTPKTVMSSSDAIASNRKWAKAYNSMPEGKTITNQNYPSRVSEGDMEMLKRRAGAFSSPVGGLARSFVWAGDKLSGKY